MRFMAQRLKPPATPAELTRADIEAFYNRHNGPQWSGADEIRRVTLLFAVSPLRELISADVNDCSKVGRPVRLARLPVGPGPRTHTPASGIGSAISDIVNSQLS